MLPIFVFPVKNEDMSIGMRKGIYILKKKQCRYRFIVFQEQMQSFYIRQILFIPANSNK